MQMSPLSVPSGTFCLPQSCSESQIMQLLQIYVGYRKLFDILNRNNTNYTRGYDHLMV